MMRMEKQDEVPSKLYKYYSPSAITKTLVTNTLRWLPPCEENDPFEGLASGWDEVVVKRAIENSQEKEDILSALFKGREIQNRVSHITTFVSFAKRSDNLLMWSHYGEKFTGACLEFDTYSLKKEIDELKQVDYAKTIGAQRMEVPLLLEGQDDTSPEYQNRVRDFFSFKAKEWEYEEEWRFIVPPMASCIKPKVIDDKVILVSGIPKGAITKLIFGYNVPVPTRLGWAKQIRENHQNCKFAEVVPKRTTYELDVVDLDIDAIENHSYRQPT
ncbi:MAG: DUF2971 domain-containing protein [Kiritimatiellae bacterium]|nr:DUF2971 domain-containing protein [Kiritimatiellia bacterium]